MTSVTVRKLDRTRSSVIVRSYQDDAPGRNGPISSVNLTPEVGATLQKGDEFGYFMFGGSDILMLSQNKKIMLNTEVGEKYLQVQGL